MAKTTLKTRRQQVKRYKKFCIKFSLKPFPCSAAQASLYAAYLADKLKPSSIRNYLSAVWYYQKIKGFPDHSSNFVFKMTLDGIERSSTNESIVRYPLSPDDMLGLYALLNMNLYADRLFWCALVLSYRAVLRCGHVSDSIHALKVKDVSVCKDHVRIHISSSKTDQFGRQPYDVYLQRNDESPLCPALLLLELTTVPGTNLNSKIFVSRLGDSKSVLKYSYIN